LSALVAPWADFSPRHHTHAERAGGIALAAGSTSLSPAPIIQRPPVEVYPRIWTENHAVNWRDPTTTTNLRWSNNLPPRTVRLRYSSFC